MSIPAQTLNNLRGVLLRCGPFRAYGPVASLFIDSRIAPWASGLPDGGNPSARVDSLISYLSPQSNRQGESALVLFLEVLADRASPGVLCHKELRGLANELAALLGGPVGRSQLYGWQQRASQLQSNIHSELKLKGEYEQLLADTTDPRARRRYTGELARSDGLIAQFQEELAGLSSELSAVQEASSPEVNTALQALQDEMKALRDELSGMEGRLAAGQTDIKMEIVSSQEAILQRLDAQHATLIEQFLKPLSQQQLELVDLAMDALDRQEIAKWEGEHLTNLIQESLIHIKRVRETTPNNGEWQAMKDLLEKSMGWQQKLKSTIPIIPMVLSLESEVSVDVWQALQQAWERLAAKVRKSDGAE